MRVSRLANPSIIRLRRSAQIDNPDVHRFPLDNSLICGEKDHDAVVDRRDDLEFAGRHYPRFCGF